MPVERRERVIAIWRGSTGMWCVTFPCLKVNQDGAWSSKSTVCVCIDKHRFHCSVELANFTVRAAEQANHRHRRRLRAQRAATGLDTLASSGSCHRAKAAAFHWTSGSSRSAIRRGSLRPCRARSIRHPMNEAGRKDGEITIEAKQSKSGVAEDSADGDVVVLLHEALWCHFSTETQAQLLGELVSRISCIEVWLAANSLY
jgi:hypothetical protein